MRSNRHRREGIGFVFVALLLKALSAPAQEAADPQVLWLDSAHSNAAFVSERLLNQSGHDERLLSEVDRDRLAFWRIDGLQGRCMPRSTQPEAGSAPDATGYAGLVRRVPTAFIGIVTGVEPGYSPWHGTVSQLITIRAEQVVHTRGSQLSPNETVAFIVDGGAVAYRGSKVCSPADAGFHQPEPGDRLFVLGGRSPEEPRLFAAAFVFPIDGSTVKTQPYAALNATGDLSLDALLSASVTGEDPQ